jgi:hypothetical protein
VCPKELYVLNHLCVLKNYVLNHLCVLKNCMYVLIHLCVLKSCIDPVSPKQAYCPESLYHSCLKSELVHEVPSWMISSGLMLVVTKVGLHFIRVELLEVETTHF